MAVNVRFTNGRDFRKLTAIKVCKTSIIDIGVDGEQIIMLEILPGIIVLHYVRANSETIIMDAVLWEIGSTWSIHTFIRFIHFFTDEKKKKTKLSCLHGLFTLSFDLYIFFPHEKKKTNYLARGEYIIG